eukprot:TRINITY_DN14007_c0_g6_i1.p1 TRINITY_DN14007_c0_g6~~TRINITY_DN14007_c0_g6_i1.p1  ORF type:complete len:544 (+),score=106.78 TRINITY_DN14007_c0_g6_i1:128-1759(+)
MDDLEAPAEVKRNLKRAFDTAPNLGQAGRPGVNTSRPDVNTRDRSHSMHSDGSAALKESEPTKRKVRTVTSLLDFSVAFADKSLVSDPCIYDMDEDEEEIVLDELINTSPGSPMKEMVSDRQERHLAGTFKTAATMFKTVVGPGLLFMPSGMRNAGLASAVSITLFAGFLSVWCVVLLLRTSKVLRAEGHRIVGFGDVGFALYGKLGKSMVNTGIILCQMGFCTAYCVFIAENLQMAIFEIVGCENLSGFIAQDNVVYFLILIVIPLQIPLTWIRQLKYFALTNFIANMIILTTVVYMFTCFLAKSGAETSGRVKYADGTGSLIYVGTAMYAFEGGATMVLPIERSFRHTEKMPTLTVAVLSCVVLLQASFSAMAYWVFGEGTKSIVTLNLRSAALGGTGPVIFVQIAWCFAVFLTFPLQLFPAAKIIENTWFPDRRSNNKWKKNAIRAGLVGICMGVSLAGYSSVDNLVALIGASGCVPLAIVFPALFHWKMQTRPGGVKEGQWFTPDLFVVGIGVAALVIAITMATRSWILSHFSYQKCDF